MITINLLPQEYRKRERTPLVILLPILGGLVCILSAGAVAAYVHFVWLAGIRNEREMLEQTLAQRQPQLRYEEALLAEEKEYKKRADTIRNIASSRILMTEKLDGFVDITVAGDSSLNDGYLIWLKELKTAPSRPVAARRGQAPQKSGGEITIKGYAVADRDPLQDYNRYHEAIKNSDYFRFGFNDLSDPAGKVHVFNDEKQPAKGWTIDLSLTLKDPADARKLRERAAEQLRAERDGKKKD